MDELIFLVINLIAEALGLKKKRTALPHVPTAPPGPRLAPAAMPQRPPLAPDAPRTIARPAGDDQTLVPEQATTLGFAERVSQSTQGEPQPLALRPATRAFAAPAAPPASPLASLFTSSDDFVRAFVMQEILQPPRSSRPHAPLFTPASAPMPPSAPAALAAEQPAQSSS